MSDTLDIKLLGKDFVGLSDSHASRRALAARLGADEVFARSDPRLLREYARGEGREIDAVIDAVGREEVLSAGLPIIRQGGTIGVYGLIGRRPVSVDVRLAPRNWRLAMHQWPLRESEAAAQEQLCDWIRAGRLDWRDFLDGQFPVAHAAEAMEQVRSRKVLKALLRF